MVQKVTNTNNAVSPHKDTGPESHEDWNQDTIGQDPKYQYKDTCNKEEKSLADEESMEDTPPAMSRLSTSREYVLEVKDDDQGDESDVGDKDPKNPADDEDDGLPIDRGWAWMILAGSFLNLFLIVSYGRALGIFFVEYLKMFEASATQTTLFMGVIAAFFSISSLFSMNILLQILGVRKTVLLGGVITTLGMLTGVFATSITFLICTHSILIGIGHSTIHGPGLVLIGQYFKKRRGLATAISMSGISFGGSVSPPLIRYLLDEYGIRGSMILLTGLTMNMLVGGLLYRPLESFRKRKPKKKTEINNTKTASEESLDRDKEHVNVGLEANETPNTSLLSRVETSHNNASDYEQIMRNRIRPQSVHSQTSFSQAVTKGQLEIYRSNPELASIPMLNITDVNETSDKKQNKKPKKAIDYLMMVINSFDFTLFKSPMFQLLIVIGNFAVLFVFVPLYIFPFAKQQGIPPIESSLLLTIYGAVDFFSRLTIGYIADLKRIRVHNLMAIAMLLLGTASHFASLFDSYALLVAYSVFIGLFGSWYNCLNPLFIIEVMGQENMAKVLGFAAVFNGFTISVTHPIMGAIKDLTGSYARCFNYIGISTYIAAICLLCEPLARRRIRPPKNDEEGQKDTKQQHKNLEYN